MSGKIAAVPGLVGLWTLNGLAYIGGLANLAGQSAYFTFVGPFRGQRLRPQRAIHQAMAVGVEAIPIVSLITFFVGLIMALQSAYRAAAVRSDAFCGRRGGHLDSSRTWSPAYRHRRHWPFGVRFRRGNRHQEGDRGSGCAENHGLRSGCLPGRAQVPGHAGDGALPHDLG